MMKKALIVSAVLLPLAACTWVKPNPGAERITQVKPEHVSTCERLGQTSVRSAATIAFIVRNRNKVATELATLARNDATKMGGDTIVAQAAPVDGTQTFVIYRCK